MTMRPTLGDLVPTLGVVSTAALLTIIMIMVRRVVASVIARLRSNDSMPVHCCDRRDEGHLEATADRRRFDPSSLASARVHKGTAGVPRRRATDSANHVEPHRETKVGSYRTPERPFVWGSPRAFTRAALRWRWEREQRHEHDLRIQRAHEERLYPRVASPRHAVGRRQSRRG